MLPTTSGGRGRTRPSGVGPVALVTLLVPLALLPLLSSCRRPVTRGVRVALHSDPVTLDPHQHNEMLTFAVLANVYESLTEFDEDFRIKPLLAEDWKNPDERTWVFRLRAGIRFHDDRPLQAADVVASLDRVRKSPLSALRSYLVEVTEVRARDERTVEVKTRRAFAALLNKLTLVAIVPQDAPETITRPLGSGPYRFLKHEKGRELTLEAVADHWSGRPAPPPLTFVPVTDQKARLRKLLDGDVDVASDLAEDSVDTLRSSDTCRPELRPGSTVEYLLLSVNDPRFADRRVREAFHLALDRERYVAEAHNGLGQLATQLVVPGTFGYAPDLPVPRRDLARARQLLAEARFPADTELVLEHRPGRRGDILAAQLSELGLEVTARATPWTELYPRLRAGQAPFYFGGLVASTADASDVLDSFLHSRDDVRGYGASNHSRYTNPAVDTLIEEASTSLDMTHRRELLQRAMRAAMKDLAFLPIAGLYDVYGVRKDVRFHPRLDQKILGRDIAWGPAPR